ncbi:MAG: formylglycine-generating enzyme family protein [Verrucomicrobiota bacterium]|nr:formylglycine-generating enzyme family protein [Verrucomicrobiota bacterium]
MIQVKCDVVFPIPLPDDPKKWDGWAKYKSTNLYERLCLDPRQNPSNELIEQHCRELLRWWQKKLPLKNQPSNPVAQMLRSGLDESSRYLTEARVELLDPDRRERFDRTLAERAKEEAILEFHKFIAFSLTDGVLTDVEERSLQRFGSEHGLTHEEMQGFIEKQLHETGTTRALEEKEAPKQPAPLVAVASHSPQEEFMRMLRLSGLDNLSMTDDQRDAFINMAENLGMEAGEAEDLVDIFLEEQEERQAKLDAAPRAKAAPIVLPNAKAAVSEPASETIAISPEEERRRYSKYTNSVGGPMLLVPSGEFLMGSDAPDAPPNERPQNKVAVSRFYMSRCPITNLEYEEFDPLHKRKRAPGTGERHPVVYVSSLEAMRFCQWLGQRERRRYRLPFEAEWEYAARGSDGRRYPWGNTERRGDLANFADKNTVFAWSDREVDDGFPESSPVGSFPLGASPFGMEDMAGNVWEWCADYFENYKAVARVNPRGPSCGAKRIYRGGSWKSRFASLRATTRNSNTPSYSCNDLGFRIVCECEG